MRNPGVSTGSNHLKEGFASSKRLRTLRSLDGERKSLAAAENIIRRHGGRLCAVTAAGKGVMFYFSLGNGPKSPPLPAAETHPAVS